MEAERSKRLYMLSIHIRINKTEDISLIFAEPFQSDLGKLVQDKFFLSLIEEHLEDTESVPGPSLQPAGDAKDSKEGEGEKEDEEIGLKNVSDDDFKDEIDEDENDDEDDAKKENNSKNLNKFTKKDDLPIEKVSENEYMCRICQKVFNSGTNARKHVKTHGIGTEPASERTCPNCNRVFKYATLCKLHIKRTCKLKKSPECDECEIQFQSKEELKIHIRTAHSSDKLKCRFCDFVASTVDCRKLHEKGVHLDLKCRICRKLFESGEEKENHICCQPEPFQCDECEKSYTTKGALKFHIETAHRGLRFNCHLCHDVLSNKQALERHIRNVHVVSVRNFKCDICGSSFKDKEYLTRHEKLHTDTQKSDPCPQCGKVLTNHRALKIHIKRVHERNFKHTCEDCGKTFPYLNTLQIHMEMVHMKGSLHMCQVCGKECIGKKRLHNHMQRKHPKGQQFGDCEVCKKEIPLSQMKSHVYEIHKMAGYKFQCDYCPKRFDTKAHIRVHLRKHTKARPYLCRGCGKHFRDLMITKKHIRMNHAADFSLCFYDVTRDISNPYTT